MCRLASPPQLQCVRGRKDALSSDSPSLINFSAECYGPIAFRGRALFRTRRCIIRNDRNRLSDSRQLLDERLSGLRGPKSVVAADMHLGRGEYTIGGRNRDQFAGLDLSLACKGGQEDDAHLV